jgi:hypothetical protein
MTEAISVMSLMDYRLLSLAHSVAFNSFLWETLLIFAGYRQLYRQLP